MENTTTYIFEGSEREIEIEFNKASTQTTETTTEQEFYYPYEGGIDTFSIR